MYKFPYKLQKERRDEESLLRHAAWTGPWQISLDSKKESSLNVMLPQSSNVKRIAMVINKSSWFELSVKQSISVRIKWDWSSTVDWSPSSNNRLGISLARSGSIWCCRQITLINIMAVIRQTSWMKSRRPIIPWYFGRRSSLQSSWSMMSSETTDPNSRGTSTCPAFRAKATFFTIRIVSSRFRRRSSLPRTEELTCCWCSTGIGRNLRSVTKFAVPE